jgi:hypothetical protein
MDPQQMFLKAMEGRPRKRILHEFSLTEISAVDRPAQKGARATIMKSDDEDRLAKQVGSRKDYDPNMKHDIAARGHALPDGSMPVADVDDLRQHIRNRGLAFDRAAAKAHLVRQVPRGDDSFFVRVIPSPVFSGRR